jgi:hypothetical protein
MITARLSNAPKHLHTEGKKMMLVVSTGQQFHVKGKREADLICKKLKITPWNF